MEFIIISGLSGAGKSSAAAFLEDLGFYCVDNMPVALITNFAGLCMAGAGTGKYGRVALVTDIRGGQTFDELFQALERPAGDAPGLSASLHRGRRRGHCPRYKETRHTHPLTRQGYSLPEAVKLERLALEPSGGGPATFSTPPGSTCPNSGGSCSACSAWGRWRRA